jgi:hypothetical protein
MPDWFDGIQSGDSDFIDPSKVLLDHVYYWQGTAYTGTGVILADPTGDSQLRKILNNMVTTLAGVTGMQSATLQRRTNIDADENLPASAVFVQSVEYDPDLSSTQKDEYLAAIAVDVFTDDDPDYLTMIQRIVAAMLTDEGRGIDPDDTSRRVADITTYAGMEIDPDEVAHETKRAFRLTFEVRYEAAKGTI